jgi:hypothetical protein
MNEGISEKVVSCLRDDAASVRACFHPWVHPHGRTSVERALDRSPGGQTVIETVVTDAETNPPKAFDRREDTPWQGCLHGP